MQQGYALASTVAWRFPSALQAGLFPQAGLGVLSAWGASRIVGHRVGDRR